MGKCCFLHAGRWPAYRESAGKGQVFYPAALLGPKDKVRAFTDSRPLPVAWSGDYVRFDATPGQEITVTYPLITFSHRVDGLWPKVTPNLQVTYTWLGNMVVDVEPKPGPGKVPLFTGGIREIPPAP